MNSENELADNIARARRMLIFECNTAYTFDAEQVADIIDFVLTTFGQGASFHPAFPQGAIRAWGTANRVDLTPYENKKLQGQSTGPD